MSFEPRPALRSLRIHAWDAVIGLLLVLEILFLLYFYKAQRVSITFNEVGFTLSSVLLGAALLCKYYGRNVGYLKAVPNKQSLVRFLPLIIFLAGCIVFAYCCRPVFWARPVTPFNSDIIPTVQIAVRRFLSGTEVYAPVEFPGWSFPMTYLPMQWMPYIFAELGKFDYRWISVGIFCLSGAVVVLRAGRVSFFYSLLTCAFFFLFWKLLIDRDPGILSQTVEFMIAGYYMLLITGVSGRNPWLRGGFIVLCLLSRFSLVLWLPLWAFTELAICSWKNFLKTSAVIILLLAVIYVIPFLSDDWGYLFRSVRAYTDAAEDEWTRLTPEGRPNQLYVGIGFARLFYEKLYHYSILDRIASLQKVHLCLSIGVPVVMGVWYWFIGRKKLLPPIFLLASFKVYMAVFLAFIQVPYTYLMVTTIAISIAIFAELPRYKIVPGPVVITENE